MRHSDLIWKENGEKNGWRLPPPAAWPLRMPIVRQIRAIYHAIRLQRFNQMLEHLGMISAGYDEWVLYAIARGWC